MRRTAAPLLSAVMAIAGATVPQARAADILRIAAACDGHKECRYRGGDLRFRVRLTNAGDSDLGVPIAALRQGGPIVRLVDAAGAGDLYLRRPPADVGLRARFLVLKPGRSTSLDWLITEAELTTMPARRLGAEVTIVATLRRGDAPVDFRGSDTLRIRRD